MCASRAIGLLAPAALSLVLLGAANAAWSQSQPVAPGMRGNGQPESAGPNKNIVRRADGIWSRGRDREDWHVLVHPDGSRTLISSVIAGRGQYAGTAIARVNADFSADTVFLWHKMRGEPSQSDFRRDAWPAGGSSLFAAVRALRDATGTIGLGQDRTLTMPAASRKVRFVSLQRAGLRRWARGRYSYTTLRDQRVRGSEEFQLAVYADGSRTLTMWHDIFARDSQFTVSLNIDAAQRPTEGFISYWTQAGYKGSTHIVVNGARLLADYRGPAGELEQTTAIPSRFSLGTHPVAGDGWHTFNCAAAQGQAASMPIYSMEASADLTKPMVGQLTGTACAFIGEERIAVPAGTFDSLHYRLAGVTDIWMTRADRLTIKAVATQLDRAYVLAEFYGQGANGRGLTAW